MRGRAILWLALPIVALVLVLPPALRLYHRLVPDMHGAVVDRFRLRSRLLERSLSEILVEPEEAIPMALARAQADPRQIAIGGFGAFDIALGHPGRFCAVGGHSAALGRTGAETPAGAFDDAADFARNDVLRLAAARGRPLGGARVWIDVGRSDPFAAADGELARVLRARGQPVVFSTGPGGHSGGYWNAHVRSYLRFYADVLAACRGR